MPNHELTPEERLRGNVNRRLKREQLEREAVETLEANLNRAVAAYLDALCAERGESGVPAHGTRIAAADRILDRVMGRATQRTEISGSVDLGVEHRSRLAGLVADHAARARANGSSK
jgi:hypothetical protein